MSIEIKQLSPFGAEVLGADIDKLLGDDSVPSKIMDLLELNAVLVFRGLGLDDEGQALFSRRLGRPITKSQNGWSTEYPEISQVKLDPDTNRGAYMKGTWEWHIDETTKEIPVKTTLLTARVLSSSGGDTQFASTYAAYNRLTDDEKTRFADLKVWHDLEAVNRRYDPDPTQETLERLRSLDPPRLQPLVWNHRSGRKSLVIGVPTSHIEGMPEDEGAALLAALLARTTEPSRVYTHRWRVGDLVIWDNCGVIHRATPYDLLSGREMHRVTLAGDEPIA
jgi:alpha-ketoglutarate-dependent taurine dioxygenase